MRLFFALTINSKQQQLIHQWCEQVLALPYKMIPAKNYHITLAFLGQVTAWQLQQLKQKADELMTQYQQDRDYIVDFTKLGLFKKPQVLYLTADNFPKPLAELALQLQHYASELGISQFHRHYTPHISIYRKAKAEPENKHKVNFLLPLTEFALFESKSTEYGVQYIPIQRWSLIKNVNYLI